ncbi:hypothetical protein Tco_1096942 [Tanacetum coccineum]
MHACPNRTGRGWTTIYEQIQTRMKNLQKTEQVLGIDFNRPLVGFDHLDKLNDLARKKRKHADDIHDYFRSTKMFKSSVQYEDFPARTVLNEPCLGEIVGFVSLKTVQLQLFKYLEDQAVVYIAIQKLKKTIGRASIQLG